MADAQVAVLQVSLKHSRVDIAAFCRIQAERVLQNSMSLHELFQTDDAVVVLIISLSSARGDCKKCGQQFLEGTTFLEIRYNIATSPLHGTAKGL